MKDKDFKQRLAYEVLIFLGLMALVMLITRLWPLLFLMVLGIFVAALRLLYKRTEKVEIIQPAADIPEPKPETEKDILRRAFSLIQQRISEEIGAMFPSAQWTWLTSNPILRIERDEPVLIVLNGAGGYRRAVVKIHNLVYKGLDLEAAEQAVEGQPVAENAGQPLRPEDSAPTEVDEEGQEGDVAELENEDENIVNYEYLAFEWVDSHMLILNERSNEAIGQGEKTLLIPARELPVQDSWPSICEQLIKNDFANAAPQDDGILVNLQQ